MTNREGPRSGRLRRALIDAAWMVGSVGAAFLLYGILLVCFGQISIRHREWFINPVLEFFLFTFGFWRRLGFDGRISLMLAG